MTQHTHITHPFPPVFDENSRVLILGSFPSVKSREVSFYYGNPQNRFWRVLAALFGGDVPSTTDEKRAFYTTLLTSGKLNSYLADIDQQAQDMFLRLVDQMAGREGVTKQLKAKDQMSWVGLMNNIADSAREVVNADLTYC